MYKAVLKLYNKFLQDKVVTIYPNQGDINGRVLLSYLHLPIKYSDNDIRLNGHSNRWESREIARIFAGMGYIVDGIHYLNKSFIPQKKYDIVFDIAENLPRFAPFLDKDTIKILHITGSNPRYQYNAEMSRIAYLKERRNACYAPKRTSDRMDIFDESVRIADICSLIGNNVTLDTFPEKYRSKIHPVTVSSSKLNTIKPKKEYLPPKKEFLWFFSYGAVHKGLDLLLEVFAKNTDITLNIVGIVSSEKDFMQIYEYELTKLPNIKYHGFLKPNSKKFRDIIKNVFCFIAPTASEGISPAVTTCLQIGLFPILSMNTGVDLPKGCGIYLDTCTIEEIQSAIKQVNEMNDRDLKEQIETCQQYALKQYSREQFSKDMTDFIQQALTKAGAAR